MVKLIVGEKGSGKTRVLIDSANEAIKKAKGNMTFIDYDNGHMFQIDYRVRFISVKDYEIGDVDSFYGFICGIISSNYDIENIYINGIADITKTSLQDLKVLFRKIDMLEMKYNVNFILTITATGEGMPDFLKRYISTEVK